MENVIVLMLFTYPGVLSYYVYSRLSIGKTYFKEANSSNLAAIGFFYSVVVTILSCRVLSRLHHVYSISDLIRSLYIIDTLSQYLFTSLLFSIMVGGTIYIIASCSIFIINNDRMNMGKPILGENKSVWKQLITDSDYKLSSYIVVIKKDGKILRAGIPEQMPVDMKQEKDIILSYCDDVESELNKYDHGLVSNTVMSYFDFDTGIELEFFYAPELYKKIGESNRKE